MTLPEHSQKNIFFVLTMGSSSCFHVPSLLCGGKKSPLTCQSNHANIVGLCHTRPTVYSAHNTS